MPSGGGFAFGPFQLDVRSRRLVRDGVPIVLTDRQFDLLHALVSHAGDVVSKDNLMQVGWQDLAVIENSLAQLISQLRRLLDAGDPHRYIQTAARRGYRFVAPVASLDVPYTDAELDALLAPHRALIDGRAALETLELAEIARARATFEPLLLHHSGMATVRVGLANAYALQFESTRADAAPDVNALRLAATHAHEACRLNPQYGEAWATQGFVLERTGARVDALAALRRAVTLEPDNWRHQLRLSFVSWGEERLRAARQTLALLPECPLAHWLAATVYVARDAPAEAEREVDAGHAAMPGAGDPKAPARFSAVALSWLKGLLCLARGADDAALAAFERELALEARGQLYARECAANTWYAIGASRLRRGDQAGARQAFEQAIARVPPHVMANAGLALLSPDEAVKALVSSNSVDAAIARAVSLLAAGNGTGAAALVEAAFSSAPPGNAGWLVPIEPMLGVQQSRAVWASVLRVLRVRAA